MERVWHMSKALCCWGCRCPCMSLVVPSKPLCPLKLKPLGALCGNKGTEAHCLTREPATSLS